MEPKPPIQEREIVTVKVILALILVALTAACADRQAMRDSPLRGGPETGSETASVSFGSSGARSGADRIVLPAGPVYPASRAPTARDRGVL